MDVFGTGLVFWFCLILFLILLLMTSLKEHSVPIRLPWAWLTSCSLLVPTIFLHVGYLSITCFCLHFARRAGPISNAVPSTKPFLIASILPPLRAVPVTTPYSIILCPAFFIYFSYYPLNSLGTCHFLCISFSFFFLYQSLRKILHLKCNWCSQMCMRWKNQRMNKSVTLRKALVWILRVLSTLQHTALDPEKSISTDDISHSFLCLPGGMANRKDNKKYKGKRKVAVFILPLGQVMGWPQLCFSR